MVQARGRRSSALRPRGLRALGSPPGKAKAESGLGRLRLSGLPVPVQLPKAARADLSSLSAELAPTSAELTSRIGARPSTGWS